MGAALLLVTEGPWKPVTQAMQTPNLFLRKINFCECAGFAE